MVMHSRLNGQRGFMTAESLFSLFFYIVMVAAIAGVGAMVMNKTAGAKGAAAVSVARANLTGMANLMDRATAVAMPADEATHMIAQEDAGTPGTYLIPGVGAIAFIEMTETSIPNGIGINVSGISSPDVCRAVANVGFGTWATTTAGASLTGAETAGSPVSKAAIETACAAAATTPVTLGFAF